MLLRKSMRLTSADVTPKSVYLDRRKFLRGIGLASVAAVAGKSLFELVIPQQSVLAGTKLTTIKGPFSTDEKINSFNDVTHYNNFYEFGVDKDQPAKNAQKFVTSPWTVSVGGEVKNSRKFTMDEILKLAPLEERIYRHRCVEGWSIVVPWIGFSLSALAKLVSRRRRRTTSPSRAITTPARCRSENMRESSYPTSKACAWMKLCTPL